MRCYNLRMSNLNNAPSQGIVDQPRAYSLYSNETPLGRIVNDIRNALINEPNGVSLEGMLKRAEELDVKVGVLDPDISNLHARNPDELLKPLNVLGTPDTKNETSFYSDYYDEDRRLVRIGHDTVKVGIAMFLSALPEDARKIIIASKIPIAFLFDKPENENRYWSLEHDLTGSEKDYKMLIAGSPDNAFSGHFAGASPPIQDHFNVAVTNIPKEDWDATNQLIKEQNPKDDEEADSDYNTRMQNLTNQTIKDRWLAIIIHEMGHVTGDLLADYREVTENPTAEALRSGDSSGERWSFFTGLVMETWLEEPVESNGISELTGWAKASEDGIRRAVTAQIWPIVEGYTKEMQTALNSQGDDREEEQGEPAGDRPATETSESIEKLYKKRLDELDALLIDMGYATILPLVYKRGELLANDEDNEKNRLLRLAGAVAEIIQELKVLAVFGEIITKLTIAPSGGGTTEMTNATDPAEAVCSYWPNSHEPRVKNTIGLVREVISNWEAPTVAQ